MGTAAAPRPRGGPRWFAGGPGDPGRRRPLAGDGLVAAAVAAVLLPLSAISLTATRQSPGWMVAIGSAFVVLHASLALRRVAPTPGFLVAAGAMLVVVLAPEAAVSSPEPGGIGSFPMLFLPSSLAFLPALYAVCARAGRRDAVLAVAMSVTGVVLAASRASDQVVAPGYPPAVQYRVYLALALLSSVSAAWGLGMSRASQAAREVARREEVARAAVLADRARIARDMHDVVAHSLAVIVRQADGGALLVERSPERAGQVLRTVAEVGREALTEMRGMLEVLRAPDAVPPGGATVTAGPDAVVPDGGPVPALSSLAELPVLVERVSGAGLRVDVTERGSRRELGRTVELAVCHTLREALTNAVKHAGPGARVSMSLDWLPEALAVEVRDEGPAGPGPGPHPPLPGAGSGLRGLRERVAAVGGTLDAGPRGPGYLVRARFPRRRQGERP